MGWLVIAVPVSIWLSVRSILPNRAYDFDFDTQHATFSLLLGYYVKIAGGMIAVCIAAALFSRWQHIGREIVLVCAAGALYAFLFVLWLVVVFEIYCHRRYLRSGALGPSIYGPNKYALTHALGWSAVIFTIIGTGLTVWTSWAS
jgi:hypothetical protein